MKLLLKTRRTGSKSKNEIKIAKTTISFKGNVCRRFLFDERENNYATLGFDENGSLCIFYSGIQYEGFLKIYKPSNIKDYYSLSINGENKNAILDFQGSYHIAEINVEDAILKIFKARLIKIN
jgi:hypothetical protein